MNNRTTVLTNVQITRNTAKATGPDGWVHGGGIFNGLMFAHPNPALTSRQNSVTGNSITASAGFVTQRGGIFTEGFHVTVDRTVIVKYTPDQC